MPMLPFLSPNSGGARSSFARVPRVVAVSLAMALGLAAAGCSTTVRQTSDPLRPVTASHGALTSDGELRIAQIALESGNVELATNVFSHVVDADPHSVPALTGLGDTLYAVGDYTRAKVYYDKALSFDPKFVPALLGNARVAIQQRRFDDAIAGYRRIMALVPNHPVAAAGLGAALDLSGDHAGAQTVLRDALRANPGDPALDINLGLSLTMSGHPREGANVLLDVTRFPDAPPQARQDLALAYGLLGNDDAAAQILSADLPKASVEDNLRYYALQRARMQAAGRTGASAKPHAPAAAIAAPHAQAGATVDECACEPTLR